MLQSFHRNLKMFLLRPILGSLVLLLFLSNCTTMSPTYQYSDGNGNTYLLKDDLIDYRPIDQANSSSGFYDGGDPQQVRITKEQKEELVALLKAASEQKSIHDRTRNKGTGIIRIITKGKVESFIIRYNAKERHAIEKMLRGFLK